MPSLRARRKAALALSSLALVASLALAGPAAADTSGGLTYWLDSDQVTITGCDGECPSSLVIPEKIGGKSVVAIGQDAFANKGGITSVTFPEGLTSIGENAFGGATAITSVTIPSTVTTMGRAAFQSMNNLASVTFAEGSQIAAISDDLFRSDSRLQNVTLPATVTSIGGAVFLDTALKTLTFKGDAPTIGENAFAYTGAVAQLATKSLQGYGLNGDDFYGLTVAGGYSRPGTPGSFRAEAALVSNQLSTTVDFTLAEWPTGKVECRLNDGAWGDCTLIVGTEGKFTVTNLTGGEQKISVRQTDGDGITSNVGSVYLAPTLIDAPSGLRTKTGPEFKVAHASNGVLWCQVNTPASYVGFRPCADISTSFFSQLRIKFTPGEASNGVTTDTITTCSPTCFYEDGSNELSYKQVINGVESFVSKATWTQDTRGPDAPTLSGKPDSPTNSTSASISFTSEETDATFQCSVDDGDFAACTSPKSLRGLPEGGHKLAVRGVDSLGNVGTESKTSWTVDTTAPAAPTLTSPASSSLSGSKVPFSASGESGAKLMCSLDGGDFVSCPTAAAAPGDQSTITVGWNTRLHWGESAGWSKLLVGVSQAPPNGYLYWAAKWDATDFPDGVTLAALWKRLAYSGVSCEDISGSGYYGNSGFALLVGVDLEVGEPATYSGFALDCSSTLAEVKPPAPALLTLVGGGAHTLLVKQVDKAGNESPVTSRTWNALAAPRLLAKVGLKLNFKTKVTTLTLNAAADTRIRGNSIKWIEYSNQAKRPAANAVQSPARIRSYATTVTLRPREVAFWVRVKDTNGQWSGWYSTKQ
ncbi:MAG: leucine-rich repeat domain-containing protein [Actinomycetes bacterium]